MASESVPLPAITWVTLTLIQVLAVMGPEEAIRLPMGGALLNVVVSSPQELSATERTSYPAVELAPGFTNTRRVALVTGPVRPCTLKRR